MREQHRLQEIPEHMPDMLEYHRRRTLQVMFLFGIIVLTAFTIMNVVSARYLLAGFEGLSVIGFAIAMVRVHRTHHLFAWTVGFLLVVYALILLAMLLASPDENAHVWLFLMPVLAYIMLGKFYGLLLSLPFILAALGYYTFNIWKAQGAFSAHEFFILSNVYLCAFLIVIFIHIAESSRSVAQRELVRLASTDPLTGLLNRGRFQAILQQRVDQVTQGKPGVAMIILDLDYFKQINDSLGHDAGDYVLVQLAQRLRDGVRTTDHVARLGGEEFGILVTDLALSDSGKLAEELRQLVVSTPFHYQDQTITVQATLGVAHCPEDALTATALYKKADRRLYCGKEGGRNQVVSTGV